MKKIFLIVFVISLSINNAFSRERVVDLTVRYKIVNFAGKQIKALAINDQIPGPTLHFKQGDHVTINVHNELNQETAIHWHGILLPWQMDGVLGLTQRGIPPGGVFHYQFTLHQSGTYWYHSHAGLQEQLGLYGAFIVDPPSPPPYHYSKDHVIVLSDWSNTNPDQIMANLKKEGDYYAPRFPLQSSLVKFIHDFRKASHHERKNLVEDYQSMQHMRMGLYDLSDVAYDAFLLNGRTEKSPWTALVKVGDTVRLRFIGAGASTIFHVKIPGANMQLVQADGNDVKPYYIDKLTIAPGETFDVLVNIEKNKPYIIYAESIDTIGAAYGVLVTSPNQLVNFKQVAPFPEPIPVTQSMKAMMMGKMDHNGSGDMMMHASDHSSMPTEATIIGDHFMPPTKHYMTSADTQYQPLVAAVKTNNPNKPIAEVINLQLYGYMDQYIWFINGLPEYKAKPIILQPGKRYRFVFTNTSMMRHPMHIHGHWFILRKGNGSYDPLLHTIDVPPGATITADVDTDASGQWFFHCHLLYHMMTGMARVVQYSSLIEISQGEAKREDIVKNTPYVNRPIVRVDEVRPLDLALIKHPMPHAAGFWLASFFDIGADPFHNIQQLTYKGLYGPDYNKLELFINDAEVEQGSISNADVDIFYWHLISQFWAVKGGANYFYRPATSPYWQPGIGLEGLMPYFIDTDVRGYYYSGSAKLDIELSRDTQITNNFFIRLGVRSILASKTIAQAEIGSGLNQMHYTLTPYYRLMPGLSIYAEYEQDRNYGAFKTMQQADGESAVQNTMTFGLSFVL